MNTTKQTNKLVYGKGMNDLNEPISKNGKVLRSYDIWVSMLRRCYSKKFHIKNPTYQNCSVCGDWLKLSVFKVWFDANYRDGLALDKDTLIPGNKVYCPEACAFVPQYINSLLTDSAAARGDLPCGVRAVKSTSKTGEITITYMAQCHDGKGNRPNQTFKTIPEAVAWYSATKTRVAGQQAVRAFMAGDITEDVYQALITREW